jgi:DNA-3-methyladenine glycosylase I
MPDDTGLVTGEDGRRRCWWCGDDASYLRYHDEEWGRPIADDRRLYEKLCLEGFQAGLSWLTILRKRESFRAAFRDFDPEAVARFTPRSVERLLRDPGIVRHRGKIESAINNARRTIALAETFGSLAGFVWSFEPTPAARPERIDAPTLRKMAKTEESGALSASLKRHGFTFVGPTTAYAFMQSVGLVNDHLHGCGVREEVDAARHRFRRPRRVDPHRT